MMRRKGHRIQSLMLADGFSEPASRIPVRLSAHLDESVLMLLPHDGDLDDIRAVSSGLGQVRDSLANGVVGHDVAVLDLDQELILIDDIEPKIRCQ